MTNEFLWIKEFVDMLRCRVEDFCNDKDMRDAIIDSIEKNSIPDFQFVSYHKTIEPLGDVKPEAENGDYLCILRDLSVVFVRKDDIGDFEFDWNELIIGQLQMRKYGWEFFKI